ncbi:MAG TPA: hypothetical protein VFV38_35970 [Ktedonobacteraceae bacterium]|nr:hypothetical protein [Ktedonobacteraceae bacterium]
MLTHPSTETGTAKIHSSQGIMVNGLHDWHDSMRSASGQTVSVRYEPFDMGFVYACIGGQWIECIADTSAHVHGRSEREWNLIQVLKQLQGRVAVGKRSGEEFATVYQPGEKES